MDEYMLIALGEKLPVSVSTWKAIVKPRQEKS